ncbi:hypothetical protein BLNAU_21552 [Blattamonas nauphoetae]|uniref:Uncharacterized protein n=1 Tax=Blattamonas nauphoetae TaxID=2049346 RepID=A0ABQ9WVL2_9EUKA|nr:hypothetical protein BLNAU_21552 [Blattamonas nauphoetae]
MFTMDFLIPVGNSFKFNEDVLDGNVFVGLNEHFSFASLNNTHFHTRRTGTSNKERQVITTANPATGNLFSFTDDTFLSCTALDIHGGAISFTHTANLELVRCSFTSCSVTRSAGSVRVYGGAALFHSLAVSGQTISITDSSFFKCSTPFIGGSLSYHSDTPGTYSMSISGCQFEENKANLIDSCFVFHAKDTAIHNSVSRDGIVTEHEGFWKSYVCTGKFESTSCEVIGGTGATSGTFGFRSTKGPNSFKFWKISEMGENTPATFVFGEVMIDESSLPVVTFEDCWFEGGGAADTELDVDMQGPNTLSQSSFVGSYSTNQPLSVCHTVGATDVRSSFLIIPDITIDTMNGEDKVFCWVPGNGNGCKTMTDTLPRLNMLFEGKLLLKCDDDSQFVEMEEREMTIGGRELEVLGNRKDKVTIVDKSTSVLFSITTGSLTLSSVSLVPSTTSTIVEVSDSGSFKLTEAIVHGADQSGAVFTKPLFFLKKGGSLTFNSVRVSTFVFQNVAPIKITNAGKTLLSIKSSNFTLVTRKEGCGVVVEATLTTNSEVHINDCLFTNCHSLDEDYEGLDVTDPTVITPSATTRGGIVRVVGDYLKPGSIEVTNSRFEGNSVTRGSGAGLYLNEIGSATITTCRFESLSADGIAIRGAALTALDVTVTTITSCDFLNCRITKNLFGAYSGALAVGSGQLLAQDCSFTDCSSPHMIDAVFLENITQGSSINDFVICDCAEGRRVVFFVWSSSGLTLSNIHILDCGIEDEEWTALSFGDKSPNVVSVDGLFVASSSSSLQKGRISMDENWYSATSSLSFSNCQFLCDEPFIIDVKNFRAGFLAPQLRVAAEADLPTTIDETICGHPSRSCRTVAFALKLSPAVLSTSDPVLIEIGEGEHQEIPLVIEKKIKLISSNLLSRAQLKTTDSTGKLLNVKQNSLLIVESLSILLTPVDSGKAIISSSGTLALTAVTFVNPSSSPSISGHLVEIADGSGTISKCVFPACSLGQGTSLIRIKSGASVDLMEQDVDLTHSELGTFVNIVGTASIESSSFSNIASISSFITGSGSLTILDSTFLSIKEKDMSPSPCRSVHFSVGDGQVLSIGAESKPVVFTSCSSGGEGGALHCSISGSGILAISHTTFEDCSSSKEGGACFVDLSAITTGSFTTGDDASFLDCEVEDGNGNGLFVVCSDLQAFLTPSPDPSPLASIKPNVSTNSVFTDEQRKLLWGRETKVGGKEGSLLFYWHPHTTGAVHLQTGGEDHVLCGLTELPCSTLSQAMDNLKEPSQESETPEVSIDSDLSLTSPLLSTATKWILRGSLSNSITIENEAQISIKKGALSSLTLTTLSIVFRTDSTSRTTPILDVQSGKIEMNDCSINSDQKSISSSASHPLVSITAGTFSINTEHVNIVTQTTRSSPLISMSGGTSSISGPITSLISSHPALSLNETAILKLISSNDFSNGAVGSVVTMEGGKIEMESSSFEKATLSSSLISGRGSVSVVSSSFTTLVDSTTSSNSETARALTLSVGNTQKVEIGAESMPVFFTSCSSRGDGGALHCSISGSGILSISHTTFDDCSSHTIGGGLAIVCEEGVVSSSLFINVTFTTCSSTTRPNNALHLTAFSFETLLDSSRWIINENQLKSPTDDAVLWGEDKVEDTESSFRSLTLLYYLFPYRHSEISSSVEGRDGEGCGHSTRPCSTFATAHSHLAGDVAYVLKVRQKSKLDGLVSLTTQDLLIEPQSGVGIVEVLSDGQISNNHPSTTNHTITITHISFDLSSATAETFFSSNNGELSLTSCSITSSITISSTLFSVSGGTLQITTLNLTGLHFRSIPIKLSTSSTGSFFNMTDTSTTTDQLISASNSTVHFSQCKLSGPKQATPANEENMCGWSTGFVSLDNCKTTLTGSSFSHFANGVIAMKDGKLEIDTSSFNENSPHLADFPSFHRNIVCVGNGLIEIETLSGGDGSTDKLSSGWMKMEENCSVVSELVEPYEVFFIPSISKTVVAYDKKTKLFDVNIEGERLIPCGLSLEVFEVLNGTAKNSTKIDPLALSPKNWTEKLFNITLNERTLLNSLSSEPEWHARLLFGVDGMTTSFKVKESLAEIKKAQTSHTMKWLLPVIIGVSALLLLILLIILLLGCRQRRKKNAPLASQSELNDISNVADEEKMEIVDESTVGTTAFVFDHAAEKGSQQVAPVPLNNQCGPISVDLPSDVGVIRGMMMDGQEQVIRVNRRDTLFNRLHRPAPHHMNQTVDKKSVEAQIAAGLVQFDMFNLAAFLSNFSPHSIIVQDTNEVLFNLSPEEKQGTTQNNEKSGNDAQRWQAPEMGQNEKEGDKTRKASHGGVFSLGLVLWEIETELVPFRELDAANAQRALATGTGLDMSHISDEALRGKIEQCLSLKPEERPTLADISSFLSSRYGELPKPRNASDQKRNVQIASKV